jgi:hypothetical protein
MGTHAYALAAGNCSRLDALPADASLYLRDRLRGDEVARIARWLQACPDSTVRVDGRAHELLDTLAAVLPRNVEICSAVAPLETTKIERVERVTFAGANAIGRWIERFPNARAIRAVLHGDTLDAAAIATARVTALSLCEGTVSNVAALRDATHLQTLELRDVAIDVFEPVGELLELRSLRLCAVEKLASIQALRGHRNLRSLWLERLPFLRRLSDLAALPALESLDLSKLWQFDMRDAGVFFELPCLRAAGIDIGGKRKNVEILKRLQLPPAPVFGFEREALRYDFTTSYECGVHSVPICLSSVTTTGAPAGFCAPNGGE